jgi:glutamate transport system substrate-binding protein
VTSKPFTVPDRERMLDSRNVTIAIATYSITPSRNQRGIDFAGPYMVSPQALLIRADDTSITTKDSLRGKSVCTVAEGTGAGVTIAGAIMATRPNTTRECVDDLRAHNTDAVFTDALGLYGYTHANPGQFKVVLSGVRGIPVLWHRVARASPRGLPQAQRSDQRLPANPVAAGFPGRTFPDAVAAYPGSDISGGDFESHFKPKDSDMATRSCKL